MGHLFSDLRSGIRMLVKYPTLSLVSIVTLGLGIGLSTTVFCIVNGALFKGLPFKDAERIVVLLATNPSQGQRRLPISVHDVSIWLERQAFFDVTGPVDVRPLNLSIDEARPERYTAGGVPPDVFQMLGVTPVLGRGLQPGDELPGADPVIVLGYDIWQQKYGGSPDVLGKTVRASGVYRTVVGVMPDNFGFPFQEHLWIPLRIDPPAQPRGQGPAYNMLGRLKPGVSIEAAQAQARTIAAQLEAEFPATNKGVGATVMSYTDMALGQELYALLFTMGAAGIGVLLIACVNVSNLLLARASLRQREVAVRIALGAGRSRVVRQHLTEVLVIALAGGAVGVLLAVLGMRWFTAAVALNPPPFWITFGLDYRVLLFVAAMIVVAALFAGGLPALHAASVNAASSLKEDSRSATSGKLGRFSSGLVVVELAVSCGLLIAAGLMIKSVVQLRNVAMPFAVDNILTARIDLPNDAYKDSAAAIRFYEQLLPRLQSATGIEAATLSDGLPAAGNGTVPVAIEGKPYAQQSDYPIAREGIVTAGYFETFQAKVLRGREFVPSDNATGQRVAIVNESFARVLFPGIDPIGHQFKRARPGTNEPWLTVVGLVPDLLMEGLGNTAGSPVGYYIPIAQSDVANRVRIAVRAKGDPAAATPFVRAAVGALDPDLALYEVNTLRWVIDRQTWFYKVFGTFFVLFGLSALLLAAAGLYGVMSFSVTQRTREMGVRSALGARGVQLVVLIMRRSVIQLVLGLAFGLLLGVAASKGLGPLLYKVSPRDVAVFAGVVITLGAAGLAATLLPARRVTRIDPVVALTVE